MTREWSEFNMLELNMMAVLFILKYEWVRAGEGMVEVGMAIVTDVNVAGHVSDRNSMGDDFTHWLVLLTVHGWVGRA